MRNFNNNRSGGQRSDRRSSGRGNFGSRDSRPSEMHDAVCAECGKDCRIPFFPRSGKPVFCSDCFEKQNSQGGNNSYNDRRPSFSDRSDRRDSKPRSDRPQVNYKEQFEIVNSKLDKVLSLLEKMDRNQTVKKPKAERPDKVKTVAEIIAQSIEE
jgi:CxxC-x17-CxxC domain-containing protein